jgi:hypothetical protein
LVVDLAVPLVALGVRLPVLLVGLPLGLLLVPALALLLALVLGLLLGQVVQELRHWKQPQILLPIQVYSRRDLPLPVRRLRFRLPGKQPLFPLRCPMLPLARALRPLPAARSWKACSGL